MNINTRKKIIEEANKWKGTVYLFGGNSTDGIDCSHFVWQVYKKIVYPGMPYIFSDSSKDGMYFKRVTKSQLKQGDLVVWKSHIGIVDDPVLGTFIGAQCSTGVAKTFYTSGYWASEGVQYFLQSKW